MSLSRAKSGARENAIPVPSFFPTLFPHRECRSLGPESENITHRLKNLSVSVTPQPHIYSNTLCCTLQLLVLVSSPRGLRVWAGTARSRCGGERTWTWSQDSRFGRDCQLWAHGKSPNSLWASIRPNLWNFIWVVITGPLKVPRRIKKELIFVKCFHTANVI